MYCISLPVIEFPASLSLSLHVPSDHGREGNFIEVETVKQLSSCAKTLLVHCSINNKFKMRQQPNFYFVSKESFV